MKYLKANGFKGDGYGDCFHYAGSCGRLNAGQIQWRFMSADWITFPATALRVDPRNPPGHECP